MRGLSKVLAIATILIGGALAAYFFTTRAPEEKVVTIKVAALAGYHAGSMKAALEFWKKEHPNIKVELSTFGYHNLEKIFLSTGEAKAVHDIIQMVDPWMPEFGAAGWLANLDELAKRYGFEMDYEDFVDAAL